MSQRRLARRTPGVLIATVLGLACADAHEAFEAGEEAAPAPILVPPYLAADSAQVRARLAARADSLAERFGRARKQRWREVWGLRRDRNAEQIALAERLGRRVSGMDEIGRLVREGRLVPLEDSTAYWVLRKMTHSVPYATPDAHRMLVRIGRRFHARLDSLGLPRYRMKITSVLRTDETQAQLRKVNANASPTVSAHEFGTTVDVSYARFAVPAPDPALAGVVPAPILAMEAEMLEEVGKQQAQVLRAELGRAIADLRRAGALMVMMENGQPVYHMTVARQLSSR